MKQVFLGAALLTLFASVACDRAGDRSIQTGDQTIQRQEEMERVESDEYREVDEGEELDVAQEFEEQVEIDD